MDVDEMEIIAPTKRAVTVVHPKILAIRKPMQNITTASEKTVIAPGPPTFFSFLKLNSSPNPNRRKITPIFPQNSTLSTSVAVGMKEMYGPVSTPAMM